MYFIQPECDGGTVHLSRLYFTQDSSCHGQLEAAHPPSSTPGAPAPRLARASIISINEWKKVEGQFMGLRYWYSQGRKNTGNTQWDGRLLSRYSGLELQARPPRPWCGFCPEAETSTVVGCSKFCSTTMSCTT